MLVSSCFEMLAYGGISRFVCGSFACRDTLLLRCLSKQFTKVETVLFLNKIFFFNLLSTAILNVWECDCINYLK